MKNIFLDLETSGLSIQNNDIVEIALIYEDTDTGEESVFQTYVRPLAEDRINKRALEVIGSTVEELMSYPPAKTVYAELKQFLKKRIDPFDRYEKAFLYGYNVDFDAQRLREFFNRMNDPYFGSWFWTPPIDVMSLAAEALKYERETMPNFKLGTVAKKLGVDVEEDTLHSALYDTRITKNMYRILAHM